MQRTLIRIACLPLIVIATAAAQRAPQRVIDPLFLISYDPQKVRFDPMPALLNSQCARLHNYYFEAWVYGHLKTADAEYFVIDGNIKPNVPEEGYGFTVEIRGSNCLVEPTPSVFFKTAPRKTSGPVMKLSDKTLQAISSELLQRYSRAFGGKKPFLSLLTRQQREELPPIVRRELEIFEGKP